MCLFILLHMSFVPALISLIVLGGSLCYTLLILLSYFLTWKRHVSSMDRRSLDAAQLIVDESDSRIKDDEFSTLV
jgi:hypothetical protein